MKILILVSILALSVNADVLFNSIPEIMPPPVGEEVKKAEICAKAENKFKTFCDNDDNCIAKGYHFCTGDYPTTTCENTDKPYCVESSKTAGDADCSAIPGKNSEGTCEERKAKLFDCLQVGIVPDPLDCRRYHNCYKKNESEEAITAESFLCPPLYAFDPSLPDDFPCRFTNNNQAYCVKTNCPAGQTTAMQLLNYPTFPYTLGSIGYKCIGGIPLITKCGPNTEIFSGPGASSDCIVKCRGEGQKAAVIKDPKKFQYCFRDVQGVLYKEIRSCLFGYIFDSKSLTCVKSKV